MKKRWFIALKKKRLKYFKNRTHRRFYYKKSFNKKFQISRNIRKKFYLLRFRRRPSRLFLLKTNNFKFLKSYKFLTINLMHNLVKKYNFNFFLENINTRWQYLMIYNLITNRARRYKFNNEFLFLTFHSFVDIIQFKHSATFISSRALLTTISFKYNWIIKFGHLGYLLIDSYTSNYPIIVISKTLSFLFNRAAYFFILKNPKKILSNFDVLYLEHYFLTFDRRRFSFKEIFHPFEFFYLLYFTFKLVDFSWFLRRLQLILNRLYIFKHKIFFSYLFLTISTKFFFLFPEFKLEGCFISLKGKLGVAGNSRKRRYFLNIGKTSRFFIKNNRRSYYKYYLLNTVSGAIGFKIWLFFN